MLVARNYPPTSLVRLLPATARTFSDRNAEKNSWNQPLAAPPTWNRAIDGQTHDSQNHPEAIDPFYLFACHIEWELRGEPTAGWEVIAATRSSHANTRAQALSLLEYSQHPRGRVPADLMDHAYRRNSTTEAGMRTPPGLEIIDSCMGCKASRENFFCRFSQPVLRSVDAVSHHTVMPAEAVLFIEGQSPRGLFVLCSGKVKLSTTSKDGKVLILKQAEAGEVLGLSAVISGTSYEMTAETASDCQVNFIGRHDFMTLLQRESEMGMHSALWLSQEFQGAYRDIHDLVLARSSSGKLARLLLSCAHPGFQESEEVRLRSAMTHEEMAQRIGSSRETVTRLLSELKKKRLIRHDGAMLVIRDRSGLEALAV